MTESSGSRDAGGASATATATSVRAVSISTGSWPASRQQLAVDRGGLGGDWQRGLRAPQRGVREVARDGRADVALDAIEAGARQHLVEVQEQPVALAPVHFEHVAVHRRPDRERALVIHREVAQIVRVAALLDDARRGRRRVAEDAHQRRVAQLRAPGRQRVAEARILERERCARGEPAHPRADLGGHLELRAGLEHGEPAPPRTRIAFARQRAREQELVGPVDVARLEEALGIRCPGG
jgi:hypothetical protein